MGNGGTKDGKDGGGQKKGKGEEVQYVGTLYSRPLVRIANKTCILLPYY